MNSVNPNKLSFSNSNSEFNDFGYLQLEFEIHLNLYKCNNWIYRIHIPNLPNVHRLLRFRLQCVCIHYFFSLLTISQPTILFLVITLQTHWSCPNGDLQFLSPTLNSALVAWIEKAGRSKCAGNQMLTTPFRYNASGFLHRLHFFTNIETLGFLRHGTMSNFATDTRW